MMFLLNVLIYLWLLISWGTIDASSKCSDSSSSSSSSSSENDCHCSIYEEWSTCASPYAFCERHCPLLYQIKPFCPEVCKQRCVCKPGYIWDIGSQQCVDDRYCATPGDENAVFSRCKANEQVYCPGYERDQVQPLHEVITCGCDCVPGFVCRPGYAKNSTGFCVPLEKCDC